MVGYGFFYQQHSAHRYSRGRTTAAFLHHPQISSRIVPPDVNFEQSWIMFDVAKISSLEQHVVNLTLRNPQAHPLQFALLRVPHIAGRSASSKRQCIASSTQSPRSSVGGILKPCCLLELFFSIIRVESCSSAYDSELRVTLSWIPCSGSRGIKRF
jgi:hypothetical protein